MRILWFGVLSFSLFYGSFGEASSKQNAVANSIAKRIETRLAQWLCAPEQYFISCFDLSRRSCEEHVNGYLQKCMAQKRVTVETLNSPEAADLALKLGQCVGEGVEKASVPRSPKPTECLTLERWQ